jgi:serine/threonine-protein kinase PknK
MPIVATKLRPPSSSATLVARPRLLDGASQVLTRRLALIHAPAGFGKTTLAMQWVEWLRLRGVTASWLTLDQSDNDLPGFLTYVVEAIRSVETDLGSGLATLIESSLDGIAEFALGELVNELQTYDREFVLVLDDWHLIHSADIHRAVEFLLLRAPPNFHLVVTSRSRENLPLARLRVQDALVEVDATNLRFSRIESGNFLEGSKALSLAAEEVNSLWRSTEGWIAALQLASISLRRNGDRQRILAWASGAPSDVAEYLAENVLSNLPPSLVDFMLKTSVLGRLSADLCAHVTGEPSSAQLLDQLERQELFLLPLDDDRLWFRYHHLFAMFLQQRLKREMRSEIPQLHLSAARWFSNSGLTAEALGHALAAEDQELAIDLVEKDAKSLIQNSYMATLLNLVAQLPRAAITQRASLQAAIAWAHCLTHHPSHAEEALVHVERIAERMDPHARRLAIGEAAVIRGCIAVYGDHIEAIEALVAPCIDDRLLYSPWVVGVAANLLAYRYLLTNELERVAPLEAWARDFQDRAEGLFSGVYGRCFSAMAAIEKLDLQAARRLLEEAVKLARDTTGRQSHAARLAGALLGQLQYEMNELEDAAQLLEESRILGFEGGVVDTYIATYVAGSRLRVQRGDHAGALEILKEGEGTARQLRLDRLAASIASEQVHVHLLAGDADAAQRALAHFGARLAEPQPTVANVDARIWETLQLANARLLGSRGQIDVAVSILRKLLRSAQSSGRDYTAIRLGIVLSTMLDLAGASEEAEALMGRAVTLGIRHGIVRSTLDEGPRVVAILERLRKKARSVRDCSSVLISYGASAEQLIAIASDPEQGSRNVIANSKLPSARAVSAVARLFPDYVFKPREVEILRLLEQGRSNKEIARDLSISVDTVKWYLKALFARLGVARRGQAIAEARRLQVIGPEEDRSNADARRV